MPRSMRWAAGFCALLSFLMMYATLNEIGFLVQGSAFDVPPPGTYVEAVIQKNAELTRSLLMEHRTLTVLMLIPLAFGCGLAFAASTRMIWPGALRREPLRKLLSRAAIVVAVARTMDGAQKAGIAKSVGRMLQTKLTDLPHYGEAGDEMSALLGDPLIFARSMTDYGWLGALIASAMMVLPFVFFWRYFGSERARQIVTSEDAKSRS